MGTGCFWGVGLTPGEMVRTRWETFGKRGRGVLGGGAGE